jgi:hypothetical protein
MPLPYLVPEGMSYANARYKIGRIMSMTPQEVLDKAAAE